MQTATTTDRATATDRAEAVISRAIAGIHATNPQAAANLEYDLAQTESVAQTFTVTARGEVVTFTSTLSDDKVLETLRKLRSSFAADLAAKFNRLSEKQYAWSHKLAVDYTSREEESSAEGAQFSRLFDTFKAARDRGLKRLTMRFSGIRIKPSKDLQSLWVLSDTETEEGNYGPQPKYLGKVTRQRIDPRLSDDIKAVIMEAANDPLTAAIRYGKETGSCSCCGRDLTNPDSIAAGIGPVCREKYGL